MSFPLIPLKRAARLDVETLPESTDPSTLISYCDISNVTYGEPIVWPDPIEFGRAPSRARRVVKDGDTLISTVRTYLKAIATVHSPPGNAAASTGFCVLTPSQRIDSRYLGYAAQSNETLAQIARYSEGVSYPAISPNRLGRIKIAAPEIETQRLIVDYLDREIAEIDALIAELERMHFLLSERRQAENERKLRSTQGVVPMRRLGLEISAGVSVNGSPYPAVDGGPGVLKTGAVSSGIFEPEQNKAVEDPAEAARLRTPVRPNTIIVNRANTPDLVGSAAFVPHVAENLYLSDLLWEVRVKHANPEFLAAWMQTRSYRGAISLIRVGSSHSMQKISQEAFSNISVPRLSLAEQAQIAVEVVSAREIFQTADADLTRAITLAKERRAALITAAVTGQIDVTAKHRPAAEQLEDDIKELS